MKHRLKGRPKETDIQDPVHRLEYRSEYRLPTFHFLPSSVVVITFYCETKERSNYGGKRFEPSNI